MEILSVAAPTDDVRQLIGELDAELGGLYAPEQRHGLALDAIFQPHIRFFIAVRDGKPLGCGGVALFSDFAEIKRMYVRAHARRTGVADAVMTRLIVEARRQGIRSCGWRQAHSRTPRSAFTGAAAFASARLSGHMPPCCRTRYQPATSWKGLCDGAGHSSGHADGPSGAHRHLQSLCP
jgi:GNAT superfamily N-acetyltransferase